VNLHRVLVGIAIGSGLILATVSHAQHTYCDRCPPGVT